MILKCFGLRSTFGMIKEKLKYFLSRVRAKCILLCIFVLGNLALVCVHSKFQLEKASASLYGFLLPIICLLFTAWLRPALPGDVATPPWWVAHVPARHSCAMCFGQ